ncbi:aminoglycoside phosphotransferase family protein [Abyssisolibacter fermentans]|uniref:aminoglycoside phosphotransferase family protein n=1 Tax=Abyssisolibacter fermentans TaxID=1766203 RepID=UPI000831A6A5|nr:aminoglycoside phosphotransferase family protein [Abyssisolibacter fermentans]
MGVSIWRKPVIDPKELPLSEEIKLISIDGYPHAGNDVFECTGMEHGEKIKFFLKVSRQLDSDIRNEVKILEVLKNTNIPVPQVIDSNIEYSFPFIATLSIEGERLSTILYAFEKKERLVKSLNYMPVFGASLSKIHQLDIKWEQVKKRKFHELPSKEFYEKYELIEAYSWLKENEPINKDLTFIHGDHHYANLLWCNGELKAVLDWELCGLGWKEFDIAWACILRPSQNFMKSAEEQEAFLEGYRSRGSYDRNSFNYCKVLIYSYFYEIGLKIKDQEYTEEVRKEIMKEIRG